MAVTAPVAGGGGEGGCGTVFPSQIVHFFLSQYLCSNSLSGSPYIANRWSLSRAPSHCRRSPGVNQLLFLMDGPIIYYSVGQLLCSSSNTVERGTGSPEAKKE